GGPRGKTGGVHCRLSPPGLWSPAMKRSAALLLFGLLAAAPALATMRCGNKLTVDGATRSEVAAKCGEPTEVATMRSVFRRPVIWSRGRPYYIGEDFIEIPVESWLYNF